MKSTLGDGEKIIIDRNFGELNRGDIIVFQSLKNKNNSFVQRIIGLPNESIEIKNGDVFINDELLKENYISPEFNLVKSNMRTVSIPDDQYFVMGDNRSNSYDSRSWGTIPKDLIYGRYYLTYSKGK